MAKMVTLREAWASIAAAIWENWGGGNCTVAGGQLSVRSSASNAAAYFGLETQVGYDLTGSEASTQLVSLPTIDPADVNLSCFPLALEIDADDRVMWEYKTTGLHAKKVIGGVETTVGTLAYDANAHKYLRIHEKDGVMYYSYSTDGLTWTVAFNTTYSGLVITNLLYKAVIGSWSPTVGGQYTMVLGSINIGNIQENFSWKGVEWQRRANATYGHGDPTYNGQWSQQNVMNPDAEDRLVLRLSNPTGASPIAAEMRAVSTDWGYGTYIVTIEGPLSTMHKSIVSGGLYLFDHDFPPAYREIDVNEASAWGDPADAVEIAHNYWVDDGNGGRTNIQDIMDIPADLLQTHRLIWHPGRLTIDSYLGSMVNDAPYFHTLVESDDVPEPGTERPHLNLWVFGGGTADETTAGPFEVTYHDFQFTPYDPDEPTFPTTRWRRDPVPRTTWN